MKREEMKPPTLSSSHCHQSKTVFKEQDRRTLKTTGINIPFTNNKLSSRVEKSASFCSAIFLKEQTLQYRN